MNKDMILGVVRHILTAVGGALASQGVMSADDTNAIVGGVVALVGLVWSMLNKKK
jgi:hypothetical protein